MKQQINPDEDDVREIFEHYDCDVNISQPTPEAVNVQLHGHPDYLNHIVGVLIDHGYSVEVDQAFEAPPKVYVRSQINPDL